MPKLLVIDDEPAILEMIQNHFTLRGYEVLTAVDGEEGLRGVEAEQPDVVLLDLKMKKIDGDEFIRRVRERDLSTRIIVITGYQDEALREKVERLGVDAFLEKPASILDIQKKVQELIGASRP